MNTSHMVGGPRCEMGGVKMFDGSKVLQEQIGEQRLNLSRS